MLVNVGSVEKRSNHAARILRTKNEKAIRACLHGGGGQQTGEVTCGGSPHLSRKRVQIKMRDYNYGQAGYPT